MADREEADMALVRVSDTDWRMWDMFVRNQSERDICAKFAVSVQEFRDAMKRVRLSIPDEDIEDLRKQHLDELRRASAMVWEVAQMAPAPITAGKDGHFVRDPERRVMNPETGEWYSPLVRDYGARMTAVDKIVKIQERTAKLVGLDAPIKVSHTVTTDTPDDELRKLGARLGLDMGQGVVQAEAERLDDAESERDADEG